MTLINLLTRLVPFSLFLVLIHAYPGGPGSCDSPLPVGGVHYRGVPGDYLVPGTEVRLDGKLLTPGATVEFLADRSYTLEILATVWSAEFKGFVMKLYKDGTDTTSMLSDGVNGGIVRRCRDLGAAGMGHNSQGYKNRVAATLRSSTTISGLTLEVTTVREISAQPYNARFILDAVSQLALTPQPTIEPTEIPSLSPTVAPTMLPTKSPTRAPTRSPTSKRPTTMKPTSKRPTTMKPTSKRPTTMKPTSKRPTTMKPTT